MATLNIGGRKVTVDDSFLSLPPDQQNATVEEIARTIGPAPAEKPKEKDGRDTLMGKVDSVLRGAADAFTLGTADEIAAGLSTGFGFLGDYPAELARQRGIDAADSENRFGYRLGGQLTGGLAGGLGLVRSGLSLGANAIRSGQSLGRVAGATAAEGAILGGLHGAGSGEGLEGRASGAGMGAALGGVAGAAIPPLVAGAQAALRPVIAPVMARLRPQDYADQALGEGLRRAGTTPDDIATALTQAQAADQGMFMVADAMGHGGQRMLSTVARTPNGMRQTVVDTLTDRQMGQGERLSRFLAEGFEAPDTAAQRVSSLTTRRATTANANYDAARQGAGAVDVSGAIGAADDVLTPGVMRLANPGSGIADDSLEGVVRRVRSLLTDDRSVVSDFTTALRAKQDIQDMIGAAQRAGRGNQVRILSQINTELDKALEGASPAYRAANDTFRQQSKVIEAVEKGGAATSSRTRAADNIQAFQAMPAAEQQAFRAGYVDPLIARVESASASPATNKARLLMTEKTGQEFPAFSRDAGLLGDRIAREHRMFQTANTALGNSKTADNLADAAEMSKFDPGVMMNLLRGRPIAAAVEAVTRMANEARGMPPAVIDRIAAALLETNPAAARQMLTAGTGRARQSDARRAIANALVNNLAASGAGRLGAP